MSNLLQAAYKYIENGICVIATSEEKKAFLKWKQYQDRMITREELQQQFNDPRAKYLAVVCGKASGNLEIIDIDTKYDKPGGSLFRDYMQLIEDHDAELAAGLMQVQTRSGGYHLYYRCEKIGANIELAQRYTEEKERKDPFDKIRVLIETRGAAGYAIAPPSKDYKMIKRVPIPTISPEQRDMLHDLARHFNQVMDTPITNHTANGYSPKEYGESPFDAYNNNADLHGKENMIDVLRRHGWKDLRQVGGRIIFRRPGKEGGTSGNYWIDKKWFSVFTTSSVFEAQKAYLPYAVYCMLECGGDYKKCAKDLVKHGYGKEREYVKTLEQALWQKKRAGADRAELVEYVKEQRPKSADRAAEIVEDVQKSWGESLCTFWDVDDKMKISINRTKLIEFLHKVGGFSLYYYDKNSTIFKIVRCRDGFLEEVSSEHIKKFLKKYIESLPDTFDGGITSVDLMELILKGSDTYFSRGILEFLNRGEFDFLKDTMTEAYFPFKNGVVKVTKEGVTLVSYSQIGKVIWTSQVIDFNILIEDEIDKTIEYVEYLNLVCGNSEDRYNYACTLIGYVLCKYKDFARPWAVILAEENDNENEGGGTGKSIFVTGLSKFIKTERVDGKTFKLDKNFAFQRVGLDTKLVAIEDCRKNVDFEGFYSIITEGMTVEKKNKDELFIPYADSPKIIFTTNYTISSTGNHARRRQRVFEFSNYFNQERTPLTHFGHRLFDEWDNDEWNRFYNFGFLCASWYLSTGILMVDATERIKRKHLRLKCGEEFLEWWEEYCNNGREDWKMLSDLHVGFLNQYDLEKKDYTQTRFSKSLSEAAQTLSLKLERGRNKQSGNRIQVRVMGKLAVEPENGKPF